MGGTEARLIDTVLGPIRPEQLGPTLIHEHLLIGWPGALLDSTYTFDRDAALEHCVRLCRQLKEAGIATLVDPCPIDLGRNAEFAAEVSQESGLQIVVATGLYTRRSGQPAYFLERSVDELAEIFCHELTEGIGSTGIRAGIVKCAAGPTAADAALDRHEEKVHRAAARAAVAAGVPVFTHTEEHAPAGLQQLAAFGEEGLAAERVLIGHCGGVDDEAYYRRLLDQGASLSFDRCGVVSIAPDERRITELSTLAKAGHVERLFVSSDAPMWWVGRASPLIARVRQESPDWSAMHVVTSMVPAMRAAGLSDDDVIQLLVRNPRRLLTPRKAE